MTPLIITLAEIENSLMIGTNEDIQLCALVSAFQRTRDLNPVAEEN